MARLARVVVPGVPHHVIQRGNRRQPTFLRKKDYPAYLDLLQEWADRTGLDVWAYCLMPNHVHLLVVPESPESLARGIGEVHRRYTRLINLREGWRGFLWQGRFASFPMDEDHLWTAVRYVLLNPVRAKLVRQAEAWPFSSAHAHLSGRGDGVVNLQGLDKTPAFWRQFLKLPAGDADLELLRRHVRTGRPLGSEKFLRRLEKQLHRPLFPGKPGRKPKKS